MVDHQVDVRELARQVGDRARELGCQLTNWINPSIAELTQQCDGHGLDLHHILHGC